MYRKPCVDSREACSSSGSWWGLLVSFFLHLFAIFCLNILTSFSFSVLLCATIHAARTSS